MESQMVSTRILHRLATNPVAHARFAATGRLPATVTPNSPLIEVLERISPRDRAQISGLTIGPELGYQGRRTFHTAEQALRWLKPHSEMLEDESWPAESWRIKRFARELRLDQLLQHAASWPPHMVDRYPRLCPPQNSN